MCTSAFSLLLPRPERLALFAARYCPPLPFPLSYYAGTDKGRMPYHAVSPPEASLASDRAACREIPPFIPTIALINDNNRRGVVMPR